MIKLTNTTAKNKSGEIIDTSLYLIHFDSRNLAIVRGRRSSSGRYSSSQIQGYYGDVKTALKAAINIAIKSEPIVTSPETILQRIDSLEKHIKKLEYPTMMKMIKGEKDGK